MAGGVEFHHAVGGRVGDAVAEDGRAVGAGGGAREHLGKGVAVEEVVSEHERGRCTGQEVLGHEEGLREALGPRLHAVGKPQAEGRAVTEQALKGREIFRRGDQAHLADAGEHERRQRVIHHRLVIDGQELLGDRARDRKQPRAGAAREHDAAAGEGGGGGGQGRAKGARIPKTGGVSGRRRE